ncbi:MAG: bifunctional alpha,alpha-trehalose-phosphate synthase (UDP-forming)/trehalose-phosphatase [Anaerolineales bacterium]|jgi:trehalose 6-phosphate synthase/phosphatase
MRSVANRTTKRIVTVSNRLPVRLEREHQGIKAEHSSGGLATSLKSLRAQEETLQIGWPGIHFESSVERSDIEALLKEEYGSAPVFIPRKLFQPYYDGFSNGCIWPLFHYFPQYAHFDAAEWDAYKEVNNAFGRRVLDLIQPGDTLWIHDYHLMLLPNLIRSAMPEAKIGFFLHIPFPSYEIFRMLPWREELIKGMLGSDLIGFHSYAYARHFLSCLLRIFGIENDFGRLNVGIRTVKVDTFPLGIDLKRFARALEHPSVKAEYKQLDVETKDRKLVISVDRMDFTKGIIERLGAFERFLETFPEQHGKVTMISLCVPSRTRVPEYQSLKRDVDEMVGRINGRFGNPGWSPILYLYRSLPFDELAALYSLADVALVTPLRDGMNLVAKEYLACHPDGSGVLVLSETAGAVEELGEAIIVNPHDERGMVQAIYTALNLSLSEQRERNQPMLDRLRRYDINRWMEDFLTQLDDAYAERGHDQLKPLQGELRDQMIQRFMMGNERLLLLDYDGTLVPFTSTPDKAKPGEDLLQLLKRLSLDPKNHLVIISGRDSTTLDEWFGSLDIDLAASHGAHTRLSTDTEWQHAAIPDVEEWKDQLLPVFEVFTDRTPGALLEDKENALAWHYRRTDPEMGTQRANELLTALEGLVANTPLLILHGNKVIEVKDSSTSKGHAVKQWLTSSANYDFVAAIGDDITDEGMFEALPEDAWSIKVGRTQHSTAEYCLKSPDEVLALLERLAPS